MGDHSGGMFFGGGFMWFIWIGIIVVIVLIVKAIVFSDTRNTSVSHIGHDKTAIEILKERYARGEIDDAEFQKKRHELEK